MPRKLLFASGLLACFGCRLGTAPFADTGGCAREPHQCVECIEEGMRSTPLDILATAARHLGERDPAALDAAKKALDAYDTFLGILNDSGKRSRLEKVTDFEADELFRDARKLSHDFRDGLRDLFFRSDGDLRTLTQDYGVF